MKGEKVSVYQYKESGLDNVSLEGVTIYKCEHGHKLVHIPHIEMLHDAIAYNTLKNPPCLTPKEFRFLRKWIGLTMNKSLLSLIEAVILCYPSRMTQALKDFFRGMGTTMDISPSDAPKVKDNPQERLEKAWQRTGDAIKVSIEQFERDKTS